MFQIHWQSSGMPQYAQRQDKKKLTMEKTAVAAKSTVYAFRIWMKEKLVVCSFSRFILSCIGSESHSLSYN